jgi:DNA-binding NarL/FixJ family response regulator
VSRARPVGDASVIVRSKVMIVSDHPVLLDGLRVIFGGTPDLEIVRTVQDVSTLSGELTFFQPDVVIVDLELRNSGGLHVLHTLKSQVPWTPIIVLVNHLGEPTAIGLMDHTTHVQIVRVSKSVTGEELIVAVRAAASGREPDH